MCSNAKPVGPFSIVLKVGFNNILANAMIDSGAGVSVMDLGTFEISQKGNVILYDASGTKMDIIGVVKVNVY